MDDLVALKLILAPSMVGIVSILGRRFGPRIAGLLAALPVVAGPTLFFFAWEQGIVFAARAADRTLSGICSLAAFSVAYAWLAGTFRVRSRLWVVPVLLLAYAVFGVFTVLFLELELEGIVSLLAALIGLGLGLRLVVEPAPEETPASTATPTLSPRLGLALRMATAAGMVAGLTEVAGVLGPVWSGLLTPFPVASTVLLVAEHIGAGPNAAQRLVRGFLSGLFGFSAFCFCLSLCMERLGIAWSFLLGLVAVILVQAGIATGRRSSRRRPHDGVFERG